MKAAIALAFILPFVVPQTAEESWLPYTSVQGRIRFEMPSQPVEQKFQSPIGSDMRSFSCQKGDVVFEAIAIDMSVDLKMAINEAVSDAEETVGRQVLDGSTESFVSDLEGKPIRTQYSRFNKRVCRTTIANLPDKRQASVKSVIGEDHVYILIVSYPKGMASMKEVDKFYNSIQFQK